MTHLTDEQILMIGRRALGKCTGTDAQHIYIAREVERALASQPAAVSASALPDLTRDMLHYAMAAMGTGSPQDAEAFVRNLLWDAHPECCGRPTWGVECCGQSTYDTLNDAQIVASLRAKFPGISGPTGGGAHAKGGQE